MTRILAIESSCDETAAAVVADGTRILSNVISSQIDLHAKYGGVVPELASRAHLEKIVPVVREACEQAGVAYRDVDAIAVTRGPGLVGSLLVGVSYAKAMAWSLGKPLVGVNHLEGHVHAVLLEAAQKGELERIEFPLVTLIVSGGHTHLYHVNREPLERADAFRYSYKLVGHTVDDAAGEAYDKVAKLLALGYPGGPVIDRLARRGNPEAVRFTRPNLKRGRAYDFSFSGIKTAVVRFVERDGLRAEADHRRTALRDAPRPVEELCSQRTLDLLASFQHAVVEDLTARTLAAADDFHSRAVFVSGGVAANSLLRKVFAEECAGRGVPVFFPSVQLSTDNAAMIAAAAWPRFLAGEFAGLDLNADPALKLGV
ncbi:MAG TPA: tRNA (adenosine(37)-N6)-threonylcarbamoyltransferase complex transferase subunit TsaD [Candidatus Xenobia bacterium]|nr:tRNA (adenosine(37)-N6)-threonylcarbamoyltransferase complex transferase subunit TsaD [Candidatus Xenobia bacterium]